MQSYLCNLLIEAKYIFSIHLFKNAYCARKSIIEMICENNLVFFINTTLKVIYCLKVNNASKFSFTKAEVSAFSVINNAFLVHLT